MWIKRRERFLTSGCQLSKFRSSVSAQMIDWTRTVACISQAKSECEGSRFVSTSFCRTASTSGQEAVCPNWLNRVCGLHGICIIT